MKRIVYTVMPFVILLGAIGLRLGQKRAESDAQVAQRSARMKAPPVVMVAPVRVQDVVQTFDAVGSVEAPLSVKIAPKVSGPITYLEVHEGDRVVTGQVLVRIDPSQIEAQVQQQAAALAEARFRLAQAQLTQNSNDVNVDSQVRQQEADLASARAEVNSAAADLANAQSKYNREKALNEKGFVAAQDVDDASTTVGLKQAALDAAQAKVRQSEAALQYAKANTAQRPAYAQNLAALRAAVAAAQAGLNDAKAQRADTILRSPLDGFVTGRYMDPGSMATPGQPIVAVQYMRQVWVTVPIPEETSASLHLGLPAQVTLDALPGDTFTGKVTQINPSADPESRQFSVRVTLDNPNNLIKPGTFAHVAFETSRVRGAVVVPREAVQRGPAGSYVVVVDAQAVAHQQPVTLGATSTDVVAIREGVTPGEKVVTLTAFPVRDGEQVSLGGEHKGKGKGKR